MKYADRARRRPARLGFPPAPDGGAEPVVPAPKTTTVTPNESELAWKLASEVAPALSSADRTTVYVKLGCGDHFDAIVDLLAAVRARKLAISDELTALIDRWRHGYAGSGIEDTVHRLLTPPERFGV